MPATATPPMTGKERMALAMRHGIPDRVPVMCQPSIGHMLIQTGIKPLDLWFDPQAYVRGLFTLRQRYEQDGILVCLTSGFDPTWRRRVQSIAEDSRGQTVHWRDGSRSLYAWDDTPDFYPFVRRTPAGHYSTEKPGWPRPVDLSTFDAGEIEILDAPQPAIWRAVDLAVAQGGKEWSIHGETISPFDALVCILGMQDAYAALLDAPAVCHAILERALQFSTNLALGLVGHGVDAIKISSPYVGGGLISRRMYQDFVMPYERRLAQAVTATGTPVYTHTCGSISDRLELMHATGISGIECLDPPPLGNVDLAEAKSRVGARLFIKGNVDSVNSLLLAKPDAIRESLRNTLAAGMPGGGYILSTACTVAPAVPAAHVRLMTEAAEKWGYYSHGR